MFDGIIDLNEWRVISNYRNRLVLSHTRDPRLLQDVFNWAGRPVEVKNEIPGHMPSIRHGHLEVNPVQFGDFEIAVNLVGAV